MKKIMLGLFIIIFIAFQSFYYSSEALDRGDLRPIEEEYSIWLDKNEVPKIVKYTKNTLINAKEPMVWIITGDALFEGEGTMIWYSMTHGDSFVETALPFAPYKLFSKTVRIEDEIVIQGVPVDIKVISRTRKATTWIPTYQFTFSYKDNLYRVEFRTELESHQYQTGETELHQDHLEVYVEYLEKHILF